MWSFYSSAPNQWGTQYMVTVFMAVIIHLDPMYRGTPWPGIPRAVLFYTYCSCVIISSAASFDLPRCPSWDNTFHTFPYFPSSWKWMRPMKVSFYINSVSLNLWWERELQQESKKASLNNERPLWICHGELDTDPQPLPQMKVLLVKFMVASGTGCFSFCWHAWTDGISVVCLKMWILSTSNCVMFTQIEKWREHSSPAASDKSKTESKGL